jgi:hypothetical protein
LQLFDLSVHRRTGTQHIRFPVQRLVIAGWAGRDEASVRHHIQELEALGVPAPTQTPLFYLISKDNLTSGDTIEVVGPDTSGEVECVLFVAEDELYVAVGSDHTDRKLEGVSVSQSKQICAKPVSVDAWPMSELDDHWDKLRLESRIGADLEVAYQSGKVSGLRSPQELLAIFRDRGGEVIPGMVMFCGTLPVIGGIQYAPSMQVSLNDPVLGRDLRHSYRTHAMPIIG